MTLPVKKLLRAVARQNLHIRRNYSEAIKTGGVTGPPYNFNVNTSHINHG